jgi:hypothetical protein
MSIIKIFRRASMTERIIVILMFIALFGDIGLLYFGIMAKNMISAAIAVFAIGDHVAKTYFMLDELD